MTEEFPAESNLSESTFDVRFNISLTLWANGTNGPIINDSGGVSNREVSWIEFVSPTINKEELETPITRILPTQISRFTTSKFILVSFLSYFQVNVEERLRHHSEFPFSFVREYTLFVVQVSRYCSLMADLSNTQFGLEAVF